MRKIQIIALFILTIGWFPFMWICMWGYTLNDKNTGAIITLSGLFICLFSCSIVASLLSKKALWVNQERLDKAVELLEIAKNKYEQATKEFVKNQEVK